MSTAVATRPLTGVQKAAIVLMQLDKDTAALVMGRMTDSEAEEIAAELTKMNRVSPDVAEQTIDEFHEIAVSGRIHARGGRDFAESLLDTAFGSDKAAGLMNRMASNLAGKSFEFLEDVEPRQLIGILDNELPEMIALVLAHLHPGVASAVVSGLSDKQRADVAQAIATMGSATPEAVTAVAEALRARAGAIAMPRESVEVVGGVQPLVDIINRTDVNTEQSLMEELEQRDPALAEEIRSRMLTFADIVKLENRDIQAILRTIKPETLATAMKGAAEPVLNAIRKNVSERNLTIIEAEQANMGAVRKQVIEEARAEVVQAIRAMAADGTIEVRRGEEDELVD